MVELTQRVTLVPRRQREAHITVGPEIAAPELRCPSCDGPLTYERSHLGGVSHRQPEQWDDYTCPVCGTFEYRHRTRKLRGLAANH